jgi:hypothetical protein
MDTIASISFKRALWLVRTVHRLNRTKVTAALRTLQSALSQNPQLTSHQPSFWGYCTIAFTSLLDAILNREFLIIRISPWPSHECNSFGQPDIDEFTVHSRQIHKILPRILLYFMEPSGRHLKSQRKGVLRDNSIDESGTRLSDIAKFQSIRTTVNPISIQCGYDWTWDCVMMIPRLPERIRSCRKLIK